MAIDVKLQELITQRNNLADNLNTMGVEASQEETLTTLVPKVLDIPSGGNSEITKGLVINECDSNGYATDISIVGMTNIPNYYLASNLNNPTYLGNISNVKIPEGVTKIGISAFLYCKQLKTLKLPSSITTIDRYAFQASGLKTFEIPTAVKTIPEGVFYGCDNLTTINLHDDITDIGSSVFKNCSNLILTKLPDNLTSIGSAAFSGCKKITSLNLPSGVTKLDSMIFINCSALAEMTCYGAITSISTSVFANCTNLKKIVLPNITSVPTLSNWNAFNNTGISNKTGYIYVPDDLVASFQSASNWSTYASQIKGVSEL